MNLDNRVYTETFSGKEIIIVDLTRLAGNDFITVINHAKAIIKEGNNPLVLIDSTGSSVYGEALEASKKFSKDISPYRKKTAMLGITGPKKVLLQSILFFSGATRQVSTFSSREKALEWLITD